MRLKLGGGVEDGVKDWVQGTRGEPVCVCVFCAGVYLHVCA